MKNFRELFESKGTIYTNGSTAGTSLCRVLEWNEQGILSKAIKKNPKFEHLEGWLEDSTSGDVKYSDPIVVSFNGKKIAIYGTNGRWRFGGNHATGGAEGFMNCDDIKKIKISELAKVLQTATIK
jgi:hypothetical protein